MCVCVCVCECVYTGISVRVCVHACVHVCLCVDLHKPCIFMCARVAVTIPRVSFPEQDQSEKFESRIPVKYRAWRAPDFHSQVLSSFVHIEWTMVSLTVAAYMSGRLACFLVAVCGCLTLFVCLFVGCLTSQQHASVSQGRICTDNFTCCHTEIEAADQTFHLTQSQYTDTWPTSPSIDPITPGAWQGSHWSANV